ncbi:MAG: DNA internalization-related competence protein ComEC/Rec2 [Ignavibacteria bacterium]
MTQLRSIPAFKFSILLITGILIGSQFIFDQVLVMMGILILITAASVLYKKNNADAITNSLIFMLIILFGIYRSNIDFFCTEDNSVRYMPDTNIKNGVMMTGVISEIPDYDSSRIRILVKSNLLITGADTFMVEGDVIADIRKDRFKKNISPRPVLNAGDEILLHGNLMTPGGMRNPGEFDYKKYLELHGIFKIFNVSGFENTEVLSQNNLGFLYNRIIFPSKIFALRSIENNLTGDEAAFLKGLVTGERGGITAEMKEDFVNAGVMHLIAVSGLNVAYIIISLTLILSLLRIPLVPRTIITIIFLIFYCLFTGSSASIMRASIMGILVLIAFLIERRINFFNVIGISVMMILIHDSKQLYDAGFILSYSAVLSMAVLLKRFEKLFIERIRDWKVKGKKAAFGISVLFFTSLAAQIGTIPVTGIYFGRLSIVSLIANIIAVPLANLSLAIGFFQIITAAVSGYISSVISETNNLLLSFQLLFIKYCAELDFAFIYLKEFSATNIVSYYIILLIMLSINSSKNILPRTVMCILIISGNFVVNYDPVKKLEITFLDVGQGDCALIQTPDGRKILTDCGRTTFTFDSGERTIGPYLRRNGINKIDLLIITHLHLDHIGGINYLLGNFEIGKIIESGQTVRSSFTEKMDSLIEVKHIHREVVRSGDVIDELSDIRIYFLFPSNDFVNSSGVTIDNNLNNGSVVFKLKYKDTEILFMGDIEKEGERFLNETYCYFLKADLLKVAHHGSKTSTTIPFIIKNRPVYAVISCGMFNKFKHPSDIVLRRLNAAGAIINRTDLDCAAIFESDGQVIKPVEWK